MFHLNSFPLQVGRSFWCQIWYTPPSFTKSLLIFWLSIQLDTWLFDLELLSDPEESRNITRNQEPMDERQEDWGLRTNCTGFWSLEDDLFLEIQSLLREGRGFPQLMAMALRLGPGFIPHLSSPWPPTLWFSLSLLLFFALELQNRIIKQVCYAWGQI